MAKATHWTCPHCRKHAFLNDQAIDVQEVFINLPTKHGIQCFQVTTAACPNPQCKEFMMKGRLGKTQKGPNGFKVPAQFERTWSLVPEVNVKAVPDYLPAAIVSDHREACLIRTLSPKASATLSRRCLQGMIRDFWGISKRRLKDEIDALEDKVDAETWKSIDAVRTLGNIGAHMEKDIDLIVDVDPNEAQLLIDLIETMIDEWYVARHERQQRMAKLTEAAASKDRARKGDPTGV